MTRALLSGDVQVRKRAAILGSAVARGRTGRLCRAQFRVRLRGSRRRLVVLGAPTATAVGSLCTSETRCGMRDAGCRMQDVGCGMRDARMGAPCDVRRYSRYLRAVRCELLHCIKI
ncbi:hypothetical protein OH76DRAFT_102433 [Lentinus brumalis]|uniref:Uncharacterized protein n=1 Tax=Lentinus brumalis TaxID=2498619 RepID=A0A371CQ96_9APHY|nr:hypothetical protein OH76DRAFT_102433 [Polyporus brumalis]